MSLSTKIDNVPTVRASGSLWGTVTPPCATLTRAEGDTGEEGPSRSAHSGKKHVHVLTGEMIKKLVWSYTGYRQQGEDE